RHGAPMARKRLSRYLDRTLRRAGAGSGARRRRTRTRAPGRTTADAGTGAARRRWKVLHVSIASQGARTDPAARVAEQLAGKDAAGCNVRNPSGRRGDPAG